MPVIPGRIPGRERWEIEDKLILSNATDKTGELSIYAGTAGEKAVEIFNGSASIFQFLGTAAAAEMIIQTADTLDPTIHLKTTNTEHGLKVFLDESMVNDELVLEGQTALKNTQLMIAALDGENATIYLRSGFLFSYITHIADDRLMIVNNVQDKNMIFQINDGGVTKTITWNAALDKLQHSAGLFSFDDDNLTTTGAYQVSGTQVVGARVVDARCDDVINSGDAVTDGVIDSLRDAMITHGLIAAA